MAQKKRLSTKIAAVALAAAVVVGGGTFAYLQDSSDEAINQFNPNTVTVALEETSGNVYEVIPGKTVTKDPTVTVNATVPAWVFVTVEDDAQDIVSWSIASGWNILEGEKDGSFVLYREVEGKDEAQSFSVISGDSITFPASLENKDMQWADLSKSMVFQAYAIQKEGFDTAQAAWAQLKNTTPVSDTQPVAESGATELSAKIGGDVIASASVPAEAVAEGAENLTLTVTPQEASATTQAVEGVKVELEDPYRQVVNYDVKIEGVAEDNTADITVNIFVGKDLKNVKVYHSGTEINDATYSSETGIVSFKTTSFSDYTVAYDIPASVAHFTVKVGDTTYELVKDFDTWKTLEDTELYYKNYLLEDDTLEVGLKAIRDDFGLTEMTDDIINGIQAFSYNTDDTSATVVFKLSDFASLIGGGNAPVLIVSASGVTFETGE